MDRHAWTPTGDSLTKPVAVVDNDFELSVAWQHALDNVTQLWTVAVEEEAPLAYRKLGRHVEVHFYDLEDDVVSVDVGCRRRGLE